MLTAEQHDALLHRLQQSFQFVADDWYTLWLNNIQLGYLNEKWYQRILQDYSGSLKTVHQELHLYSENWLQMGDYLQNLGRNWYELGLFDGWRNECFDVCDTQGNPLFPLERAIFRPLGLFSHAVHINGYTKTADGIHFWIGKRSPFKAVDPDKLDNLVGGGIASGESVFQAMQREAWEEAGIAEEWLAEQQPQNRIMSLRTVARGLHRECLHIFDLCLPENVVPENQDGEVASFSLMTAEELTEAMCSGQFMNDAMLVSIDLLRRLNLLDCHHPLTGYLNRLSLPLTV